MAFDGVFAFQGKDHITASQLGRIVEGVAGKGRYVLPTLDQMTAEMQTANKVRVCTGDLVMDGRVVTNEAAVDLTVESGTSGYKRNDLVVCRYTKNASTGVENFAAEVVKGTPTTGTAADPKVTEGDISSGSASAVMPLWRIPLNGITPGAPVRIAPVASTLKTLGDSVSRVSPVKLAVGTTVIKVGENVFWDLMSYSEAASELGCSVADFAKSGLPSARLACFVSNGDPSTKTVGAMHAEFDDSRKMIRVQFGQVVSSFLRINWMLALNTKV
ncbi:hypothetical protein [Olsenella uli]|uniref:hypothetical protein n=1 Tax=Olsenella uli TaxID=133926 RepID=UPI0012AB515A|nr:hypothetical protein [Olsenella uli]